MTSPTPSGLTMERLQSVLAMLAADDRQGAQAELATDPRFTEALRGGQPSEAARALGDLLVDDEPDLANEAYRAAFYFSGEAEKMADNPLFAYFLAHRSGAALDKWVHYFPVYHRYLERFRGRAPRVLEVGVYDGGGLQMWQHYFGEDAVIIGADIEPAAGAPVRERFTVEIGDQADPEFLRRVAAAHGPFDVVLDDGGHTMEQQIVTAETLFPLLAEGGTLLVEDCHTSYMPDYGGGPGARTFLAWAHERVADLHSRYGSGAPRDSVWATDLDGIHLHDSVVVLEKHRRFRPFTEVAGTSEYLRADRPREAALLEMERARDVARIHAEQLEAEVARLRAGFPPPVDTLPADEKEEELRRIQAALRRLRRELAEVSQEREVLGAQLDTANGRLLESWEQIRLMRRSVSWRLTTPLRAVRSLLR